MGVTQEGEKCIFMLCMEVAEEDMEVQEETVYILGRSMHLLGKKAWRDDVQNNLSHFR